jgi:hypothetical protein
MNDSESSCIFNSIESPDREHLGTKSQLKKLVTTKTSKSNGKVEKVTNEKTEFTMFPRVEAYQVTIPKISHHEKSPFQHVIAFWVVLKSTFYFSDFFL